MQAFSERIVNPTQHWKLPGISCRENYSSPLLNKGRAVNRMTVALNCAVFRSYCWRVGGNASTPYSYRVFNLQVDLVRLFVENWNRGIVYTRIPATIEGGVKRRCNWRFFLTLKRVCDRSTRAGWSKLLLLSKKGSWYRNSWIIQLVADAEIAYNPDHWIAHLIWYCWINYADSKVAQWSVVWGLLNVYCWRRWDFRSNLVVFANLDALFKPAFDSCCYTVVW